MSTIAEMAAAAQQQPAQNNYIGRVEIIMTHGGGVRVSADVPTRSVFNAMMLTALQDVAEKLMENEKRKVEGKPELLIAGAGIQVERNPKA